MLYKDFIYGEISIQEPVLLELIKCKSLQRLKGIDQAGYVRPYFPKTFYQDTAYSRFEHSLGVMILLKKYRASLNEQISGLIHDVSHSSFSHGIDYALSEGSPAKHNHQDNIFKQFVSNSGIPKILAKHHININFILNDSNFPLKEQKLPNLCADRIDYSIRSATHFSIINQNKINYFLDNLMAVQGKWVFKNYKSAKEFAIFFHWLDKKYFSDLASGLMMFTIGEWLKHGLNNNYIFPSDLYTIDAQVIKKNNKYLKKDTKLNLLWQRANNKIKFVQDKKNYNSHIVIKAREVDPLYLENEDIKNLSSKDLKWKQRVLKGLKPREFFIRFEK